MSVAAALLLAAAAPSPATILVGQFWIGVWRDGRLLASHVEPARQIAGVRIHSGALEVAYRAEANPNAPPIVRRFDAATLHPLAAAGASDPNSWPMIESSASTDLGIPDATRPGGPLTVVHGATGDSVRLRGSSAPAHMLPAGSWRYALSPDASTAAAFRKPSSPGAPWRAMVWNARTGHPLAAKGMFIDDGSSRAGKDFEGPRELACLLPNGTGAIFTYAGPPADRLSEYQPANGGRARQLDLKGDYVADCLSASR